MHCVDLIGQPLSLVRLRNSVWRNLPIIFGLRGYIVARAVYDVG